MSYHTLKTADGGKYGLKVSDAIVAVLDKCGQCLLPHQACHCQNR